MIIVLSFDARDGASAKRLAARYNEVIVIKDEVLETKRYNLSAATPISQRDELAHLTRITIIGHSNSTNKFGKYNVTQFSNFIYEILKANATGLTELTAIDLFGCEVGRIEFVAQKSDQSSVTARDFKSDVSTAQFRSFVRDFEYPCWRKSTCKMILMYTHFQLQMARSFIKHCYMKMKQVGHGYIWGLTQNNMNISII